MIKNKDLEWIHLPKDMKQWRTLVDMVMNLTVL
jgi:hypothetical protein